MKKATFKKLKQLAYAVIISRKLIKKYTKLTAVERDLLYSAQKKISDIAETLTEKELEE